jgi:class 3 adenylate cyclase
MPLAAAANCLAGFLIVWLVFDVAENGLEVQARAGAMTAGLLIVMFFGFAIFRISLGLAMLAITPYVFFGSYRLYAAYDAGELAAVEAATLGAAQWIAYCGCLLVCIVIEVVTRRTFCKDQIIEAQQFELRTSRETIRRYVPPAVVEHIIHGDTAGIDVPSRRRVTVLFGDLVDFTPVAERVEAEVLTKVVNDYLTAMSQIVARHGGTVNEFAGDGFMALFGAPDELTPADQALSAVRAAAALQAHVPALNAVWARLGVPTPLALRIGINTGLLSVGSFGSEGRMTYTAIGLETNIASRIQSNCEPGGILISETTWQLVNDQIECEPRGEVACKGVRQPVRVHAPLEVVPH